MILKEDRVKTILNIFKEEWKHCNLVYRPYLLERLAISTGAHILNRINNEHKLFYSHGKLKNLRNHFIIMDTSGYGKTIVHHFCLADPDGLLFDIIPCSQELKISDEGFVGTMHRSSKTDEVERTQGLFGEMKDGIVGIEEFTRFAYWCQDDDPSNLSQGEEYMMVGMDSNKVPKRLASGSMPTKDICTTIWGAMRYQRINFGNGLARRCTYGFYNPTYKDALKYIEKEHEEDNIKIDPRNKESLKNEIDRLNELIPEVIELDYSGIYNHPLFRSGTSSKDVLFPHFERDPVKRMIVGWSIANGRYPELKIDKELHGLIENELENRDIISHNPRNEAVYRFIRDLRNEEVNQKWIEKFLFKQFQMDKKEIELCLAELKKDDKIIRKKGEIYT